MGEVRDKPPKKPPSDSHKTDMEDYLMNQSYNCPVSDTGILPSIAPETPESAPLWHRCLSCEDWGISCRGFDITSLDSTESVRHCHKAIRKAKNITIKAVADYAKGKIGESTVNEYFGSGKQDYKFTTVITIHNGLLYACSKRDGLPVPSHSCHASSSEARQQLAAADMKLAAADMKLADAELKLSQSEADMIQLQQKLTDVKGRHIAQISQLETNHTKDIEWFKNDIHLWRRFAFLLLGIGVILLAALVFYIGWDVAHPATGIIRY